MNCAYKNFLLFDRNDISSLYISLSAVQFAITEGTCFALEFTGISSDSVKCSVKSDTLFICNNLKLPGLSYFDHTRNTSLIPYISILLLLHCAPAHLPLSVLMQKSNAAAVQRSLIYAFPAARNLIALQEA